MKRRTFLQSTTTGLFGGIFSQFSSKKKTTTFEWKYNNQERSITIPLDSSSISDSITRTYSNVIQESQGDSSVQKLAKYISSHHSTKRSSLSECLTFVQREIEYQLDFNSKSLPEYPRYASETLDEEVGDCIDQSVLFSSLANELHIPTFFIFPQAHAGVLVPENHSSLFEPKTFSIQEKSFVYVETTSENLIGEYPSWLRDQELMAIYNPQTDEVIEFYTKPIVNSIWTGTKDYISEMS